MIAPSRLARFSAVLSFGIVVAAAKAAFAQPRDNPPILPIKVLHHEDEVLHQEYVVGSSGQLLMMPNEDLLAVGVFPGIVRFDQTGRVLWRRSSGDAGIRHTVALPGGGFVSTGSQKALPFSLLPPGVAIKGNIDLWVGRFDDAGDLLWAKTFGDLGLEIGQSVAALRNGITVVAGFTSDGATWLLELTSGGRLRGESHLLTGSRSAVVALTDSEVGVVAQVPVYPGDCRDAFDTTPVKFWRIDTSFGLRDVITVRNDASGDLSGCGWHFEIARGLDETHVFVVSAWTSTHKSPPTPQITKVDLEKGRVWSSIIPEAPDSNAFGCQLSMTILPSGDPVVTCTSRSVIELHHFDAADGLDVRFRVDWPDCGPESAPAGSVLQSVEIQAVPDGNLILAGRAARRLGSDTNPDAIRRCSWLAKVSLPSRELH